MTEGARSPADSAEITAWLVAWSRGDAAAAERLLAAVYEELRRIARRLFRREQGPRTLEPTAVVNEALLRLLGSTPLDWRSRTHFFAIAAKQMRRVLVEHARARNAAKRGGGISPITLVDAAGPSPETRLIDMLILDEVLARLERVDPELVELVELRYFAGMTIEEAAVALGQSHATVERSWATARAFLHSELARVDNPRQEASD